MTHNPQVTAQGSPTVLIIVIALLGIAAVWAIVRLLQPAPRTTVARRPEDPLARYRGMVLRDPLTGLPNRASLTEQIDTEIARSRRSDDRLSLSILDLDDFKEINELHGHPIGDEVLRALGRRMRTLVDSEPGTFIARIGGDEFAALRRLTSDDVEEELDAFLQALLDLSTAPIELDEHVILPEASVGSAIFPEDATDSVALIRNATLATHRAKSSPHRRCRYDSVIDERTRARQSLAADLRQAIDRDELVLHYQVQASVPAGEVRGYEALLRWHHPKHGLVPPDTFIPLAESSRLIISIGAWVLHQACAEAARWQPPYRVSVNVSAVQLSQPGLVDTVKAALAASGLPAARLELEMTETAVFSDREEVLQTLTDLKAIGVALALDDFGAGYSSLDVLRSFPFDRLKIDRSFLAGTSTHQTLELIRTVLAFSRTFGLDVIAEGIETSEQRDLLALAGCPEAQGYFFGRPTTPEEIARTGQLRRTLGTAAPIISPRHR